MGAAATGAKFGLDSFPERPYMHTGFIGHESKRRAAGDESQTSRRSKSPGGAMNASLDKINVLGKQAD